LLSIANDADRLRDYLARFGLDWANNFAGLAAGKPVPFKPQIPLTAVRRVWHWPPR
jgi:hypothetical protein